MGGKGSGTGGLGAIIGHQQAVSALNRMIAEDRIPGALLFTGPEGVGKRTAALGFAEELLGRDLHDVLMDDEGHYSEDLIHYRCEAIKKSEIKLHGTKMKGGVSFIREQVLNKLALRSSTNGWRAVILTAFDAMNHVVWDTLLKTLEEPPARTVIILTTARRGLLPITILSRCREVVFTRLARGDCARVLVERAGWGEGAAGEWAELSDGSPGRALALSSTNLLVRLEAAERFIEGADKDVLVPFELTKELKRDRNGAAELAVLLARRIRNRAAEDQTRRNYDEVLETLALAADDLLDAGLNPDAQLVMDDALIKVRRCLL